MVKDTNKRMMITLTEKEVTELEEIAQKKGFSKSIIIKIALQDYIFKEKIKEDGLK